MRLICCDTDIYTRKATFSISPMIKGFLIPNKGTQCRKIFFKDDGALDLRLLLEKQNNYIDKNDLLKQEKFLKNQGLFVKIIYERSFVFQYSSEITRHCTMDLYRANNGHYRLISDEMFKRFRGKLGKYEMNKDSYDLYEEINGGISDLYSQNQLERMFKNAERIVF